MYLQLSLIRPPTIARLFEDDYDALSSQQHNVDLFGEPFTENSRQPPFVRGTLDAACDLSELLYKTMTHNSNGAIELGSDDDLNERSELYAELIQLRKGLPVRLRDEENFTPQTCFLR